MYITSLNVTPPLLTAVVNGQHLQFSRRVIVLRRLQLAGLKGNRLAVLHENTAYTLIRGVTHHVEEEEEVVTR
jgi:hypothetical protein